MSWHQWLESLKEVIGKKHRIYTRNALQAGGGHYTNTTKKAEPRTKDEYVVPPFSIRKNGAARREKIKIKINTRILKNIIAAELE
jgi:hypothetical protein